MDDNKVQKKGILERLAAGPVIGDGGFTLALEKRGYVKAGDWTPQCTVTHPEAVRQLHREFLRAGADVMQAFTFYAHESKISSTGKPIKVADINNSACAIAHQVAQEGDGLVAGCLSQTQSRKKGKAVVQAELRDQLKVFVDNKVDFIICEFFMFLEEIEWAIEVAKESGLPVAATMCMGPNGDCAGVPTDQCAIRMAKAGADIVGMNCNFEPSTCLKVMEIVKAALEREGLKRYLMIQPNVFKSPDVDHTKQGYLQLPEFPFALEPRVCTRFEVAKYAREAYEMGIHYIGGCCGFEPHHIRAVSEELEKERGKPAPITQEQGVMYEALRTHQALECYRKRGSREFWMNLEPSTGRPLSTTFAKELLPWK